MNKRRISIIAVLLTLILLASLTACNGAPATGSDTELATASNGAPTAKPDTTEETEKTEAAPETEPPESEASETASGTENTEAAYDYEPERYETDTLTWEFDADTGTLSVHGEGPMRDYSGEAPEWEPYKDQIIAVTLDDGITSVGA